APDPDRLRHRDLRLADAGNAGGRLLGEAGTVVRLGWRSADDADYHEGGGLEAGRLVAVGEDHGGTGRKCSDILETAEVGKLERHQPELLRDRDFLADLGRGKHLANGLVGVDLGGVLRDLHGDIAGEAATG